jgi:hypothetical protein
MRLLVLAALVLAAAYVLTNRVGTNPLSPQLKGGEVTVESRQMRVRFQRGTGLDEAYMLFGGDASERSGHFSNVLLSGLAERHVYPIAQRYPDFYLCRSPGAESAKRLVETMSLIGGDGRTRKTLLEALRLYEESIRSGGERTCVHLKGEQLHLVAAQSIPGDIDLTEPIRKGHRTLDFYLIEHAEIVPCQTLTRN